MIAFIMPWEELKSGKMKNEIYSVSEAYSMQPSLRYVGQVLGDWGDGKITIDHIGKIIIQSSEGVHKEYYRGFTKDGDMVFSYLADSVNVNYI